MNENEPQLSLQFLYLFQPSVAFHIETSHLFYRAKQMTGNT